MPSGTGRRVVVGVVGRTHRWRVRAREHDLDASVFGSSSALLPLLGSTCCCPGIRRRSDLVARPTSMFLRMDVTVTSLGVGSRRVGRSGTR